MSRGFQGGHSVVVTAFETTLRHQFLIVLLIAVAVMVVWNVSRTSRRGRAVTAGPADASGPGQPRVEPLARRVLRIGFGLLWVFDGFLQTQSSMPLGVAPGVLQPSASSSPGWVQHVVNVGVTLWGNHPVSAAAAAVWIPIGVGLLLLVAPRGRLSRYGGAIGVGWGLVVWVFGEGFGGVFGHGSSWALGTPGAVVFYIVARALIALPERAWETPKLGRGIVSALGAYFVGMALLQAWPGRGFWQGHGHGAAVTGTLAGMVREMARTPQPGFLSSWVGSFASFDAAHGWGVNLFLVIALAAVGVGLASGRPGPVRWAVIGAVVIGLADWVLVQDLGFLGGVGTDPNSMLPLVLVCVGGYLALVRLPAPSPARSAMEPALAVSLGGWWGRLTPTYRLRALAAVGATAVVLFGAAPMAFASINPHADPILAQAFDGTPSVTDTPAPPFALVDQHNRPVSLASLRGKTVALTFLDPVCTSDCPLIAQEFRQADGVLGPAAKNVVFIAIVANPIYRAVAYMNDFDRQEGLTHVSNWLYLTGSVKQLQTIWNAYGAEVYTVPAGSMVAHADIAFVIDGHGRTRVIMGEDQNPGATPQSSFSDLLADQIRSVLSS